MASSGRRPSTRRNWTTLSSCRTSELRGGAWDALHWSQWRSFLMSSLFRPAALVCLVAFTSNYTLGARPDSESAASEAPVSTVSVDVAVDVFSNRHPISPFVYGAPYPNVPATITY